MQLSDIHYMTAKTIISIAAVIALTACSASEDQKLREFLSRHDSHWTEIRCDIDTPGPDRPSGWKGGNKEGYYSGALMGNGLLGTNMYKAESANTYRLNVGRSDVTEQRIGYDLYKKGRLPIGYFTLSTVGNVTGEQMDLSIYDAESTGTLSTDRGAIQFATYVHAINDCIVFETSATGEETEYRWDFVPFKAISPRVFGSGATVPSWYLNSEGKANPDAYRADRGDLHCLIQPLARDTTFTDIAKYYAVAWKEAAKGASRRIIATVTFEDTEEDAVDEAAAIIEKGLSSSSKALRKSHRGWWHDFYKDVAFLTFPDPEIESFYWMQYYKFASTARPGKPVLDLQGVWPTWDTPWPAIWMNLNIQLTYSFLTKANMGEFAQPLWDSLWEHRENLTRNVTDISGQEAWTDAASLGRTCSYDLYSPLSPSLAESNQYEAGNLCWTLFYWYQQCMAYGDDEAMRDRLFPLLKSAVNLFFHIRITNPDGTYSLPATASPEYPVDNAGPNTNYDLANLRQALTELIEIDTRFGINDPMLPEWKDFLAKMPDFQYSSETGFKVSETIEFTETDHRHYSHLFMIYPYHMLDWNDAAEHAKAELSIDRWQGDQGYSRTGKAAMLASEGLGDGALEQFEVLMTDFLKPNTLYAESGPVIETPLAGVSTLHEFYMQDWGDRIRVFHGCPTAWKNVTFRNMRASGAFLVSAERRDGRTISVDVFSEKGNTCRLQTDMQPDELKLSCNGKPVSFKVLPCAELGDAGSLIEFNTTAGTTTVSLPSCAVPRKLKGLLRARNHRQVHS